MTELEFMRELLDLFARLDACEELRWSATKDGGPIRFEVDCSDWFWWGTADGEPVTAETLPELRQAVEDAAAATGDDAESYALGLYCCRRRGMRPQHANYTQDARPMWALYDACGPERPAEMTNPPGGAR